MGYTNSMARLLSAANGAWLTAATFHLVDATSLLDSEANNTQLTTSPVASSATVPGAIEVDGVAVKIASVAGSTGTITIELYNSSDSSSVKTVTINIADLPQGVDSTDKDGGWVFFKFDSAVTLAAAKNHTVRASVSAGASAVYLFRDATANNWSRMLRTTTDQAPSTGDDVVVAGEHTGAGTGNDIAVTMDVTATTDHGKLEICKRGTLSYGTSAATNYYLKLSGDCKVYKGGTFNIGTSGAGAMPSDSSAVLEFDCGSDGQYGLIICDGATFTGQGYARGGLQTTLGADEAIGQTVLTITDTTGMVANDEIVLMHTGNGSTTGQSEKRTISTVDSPTQVTVSAGLTNAHNADAPDICKIYNLTRNVKIRSASATNMTYVFADLSATVDMDYVQLTYLGTGTTGKRGFEFGTDSTGSLSVQYCTFAEMENYALYATGNHGNWTFSNNYMFNLNTNVGAIVPITIASSTQGSMVMSNNIFDRIGAGNTGTCMIVSTAIATFTGNHISCSTFGVSVNGLDVAASQAGTWTGNTITAINGYGLRLQTAGLIYDNFGFTLWRNTAYAIYVSANVAVLKFSSLNMDNNGSGGTYPNIDISAVLGYLEIIDGTIDGSANYGIRISTNGGMRGLFINTDFGVTSAHSSADIQLGSNMVMFELLMLNCNLASGTEINDYTALPPTGYIKSHKHDDGTTYKMWSKYGISVNESTIRHTASGYSWKMTPNNASNKLRLPGAGVYDTFKAAVNASTLVTVKAWFYKDASYSGNAPRLVLKGGMIGGIASDSPAPMTVGAEEWEELTVTGTPNEAGAVEYYMDCDGTAGSIYVDDVTISQA